LQSRVFSLFDESLDQLGDLALGSKETLKLSQGFLGSGSWGRKVFGGRCNRKVIVK